MKTIQGISGLRFPKTPNAEMKKRGRPPVIGCKAKRYNVYLDQSDWDKAYRLGEGNISRGLRIAIRSVQIKAIPKRRHPLVDD